MTASKSKHAADSPLVLPVIAGKHGSRETIVVSGTLVAVVPQLATKGPAADRIRALAEKLDKEGKLDKTELDTILTDDEVMYIVVGKWPPPTISPAEPPVLSERAQQLVDGLRKRDVVTMVLGPWPP